MRKLLKILFLLIIFIFALCISSYATTDVSVQDELVSGLFSSITTSDNSSYTITVDASKLISLLSSTLTDSTIYNNLYIKLPDTATQAVVTYSDNTSSNLEIATTSETNYAICPVPVFKNINNVYYPNFLDNLQSNNSTTNSGTIEFFDTDNTSLGSITFSTELDTNTFSGALIYIESTSTDEYLLKSTTGTITNSSTYNRIMTNGTCTINVLLAQNIGDSITLSPFGELSYVGTSEQNSVYTHLYSAEIADTSILASNIFSMFVSAENNILQVYELNFEGDLEDSSDTATLNISDSSSNIKLEAASGVIPNDSTLTVESITSGTRYDEIKSILGDVNFTAYSISIISNSTEVQPTSTVKVSIPIPTSYDTNNLVVYRIDSDGTKTEYSVTVDGTYAVFETDHFSDYVLVEKNVSTTTTTENTTTTEDTTTSSTLDSEPKTGISNVYSFVILALIISLAGLAICIKKLSK